MPPVHQYQLKEKIDHTPTGYLTARGATPDAFGASIAKANEQLGATSGWFAQQMFNIKDRIQEMNARELANYIDTLERTELQDPENGYYAKLGKDAMDDPADSKSGAKGVLQSIEKKINEKQQQLGLTWGIGEKAAESVKARKLNMLYNGAYNHQLKQTQAWASSTLEEAQSLAINKGITHRDNPEDIKTALGNGLSTIISKSKLLKWDNDTTRIQLAKFTSDFHSGVLNAYLQDGSLKASEYYEANKEKLLPEAQQRYLGQVKNNELNYVARSSAERLFGLYPEDEAGAFAEVDKIENEIERNAVENRLTAMYNRQRRIENHTQDQLIDGMWDKVAQKMKNGEIPSEDDIPYGLNGKNWFNAQSAINQLINKGDIDTDNSAYLELYELRNTDAQKFANMNLTQYRAVLSNADYKAFQKMQVDIKNMTPTQLTDQDNAIKAALKTLGYSYNKQGVLETDPSWFIGEKTEKKAKAFTNTANAYIKELELKKGKNLTQGEINSAMKEFAKSYAYKGKDGKASDMYTEGMNKQVGFMRNLLNDFNTAEKAKGSPLTDDERNKIISDRISKQVQEDNEELSKSEAQTLYTARNGDIWQGHTITSVYGNRKAPKAGASTNHKGVDLRYKNNEVINAFASGTVTKVGYDKNGWGNYVEITSDDGTIHRYAHANSISAKKGQKIAAGDRIGRAGSTGNSTGTHLHYEKIKDGESIDPIKKEEKNNIVAMKDAQGNRALVEVDAQGKPIRVVKEL